MWNTVGTLSVHEYGIHGYRMYYDYGYRLYYYNGL